MKTDGERSEGDDTMTDGDSSEIVLELEIKMKDDSSEEGNVEINDELVSPKLSPTKKQRSKGNKQAKKDQLREQKVRRAKRSRVIIMSYHQAIFFHRSMHA